MINHPALSSVVRHPHRAAALLGGLVLEVACFSALSSLHGQGAAAPAAGQSGKEYVLAKSSSFKAPPADSRNPFWPIGWTPSVVVATQAAVVYDVKPEQFVLSTTSVDVPPLAIINGKSYTLREQVPVPGSPEIVTVKSIQDGMVVLDHHGRELRILPGGTALKKR